MKLSKYGKKKCMINNGDGTYCFLNVTFWDCIKFYILSKLTGEMLIKESNNAEKKGLRPEDLDR